MNITRFEPWSLLDAMQRDFDRLTGGRRMTYAGNGDDSQGVADWSPAVDVVEKKDHFLLRADLPGVAPEDIEVSMDNGILTVAGNRLVERDEEVYGVHRIERISGRFYRRFSLPETADAEHISAKSTNGILEVVIAKRPEVTARRITVEGS